MICSVFSFISLYRFIDPFEIDANKPIKTDVESQSVDVPSSTTIALSSNEPDDKNHSQTESQSQSKSQSQSNDDKKSTGKLKFYDAAKKN